ncbi:MAG: hypothetical protein RTU09_05425 [Candidatus Thorarchaeota archaeon]
MKVVTWVLRILSTATFTYMAYLVYMALDESSAWGWSAPYDFVITVFHLLSLLAFFLSVMIMNGLTAATIGGQLPDQTVAWLYNTLVLNYWNLQPYGVDGPISDVNLIFQSFQLDLFGVLGALWDNTFSFLFFLLAGLGVALFLQSLVRMDHKFSGGAFLSIQSILILGAYRGLTVPDFTLFPADIVMFLTSSPQILALVSFAYLEFSYQMIYSHNVGRPVEDREETLKKQLLALRQATQKQDAIERGEKVRATAMSRASGATAFSFLREAIERKVLGGTEVLENLDAVSDVRRLQHFVDNLLVSNPSAREELTAKAAAPSESYVIGSTITGSAMRLLGVVIISFLLMSPALFVSMLSLPPGVEYSAELLELEFILIFLLPISLLFVFASLIIGWFSKREEKEVVELTKEEKEAIKKRREELKKKKKAAVKARRARKKAKKKRKAEEGQDEWDRALEDTYKR